MCLRKECPERIGIVDRGSARGVWSVSQVLFNRKWGWRSGGRRSRRSQNRLEPSRRFASEKESVPEADVILQKIDVGIFRLLLLLLLFLLLLSLSGCQRRRFRAASFALGRSLPAAAGTARACRAVSFRRRFLDAGQTSRVLDE